MADNSSEKKVLAVSDSAECQNAPTDPSQPDMQDEPPWSAWRAIYATWLFPKKAASRMQHVSLAEAFLAHFLAAIAVIVLITFVFEWDTVISPRSIVHGFGDWLGHFERLYEYMNRSWLAVALVVAGYVLAIEAGFLVIALIVAPWGAGDESFSESIRNAVRQTWLHTMHFVPVVFLVGSVVFSIDNYEVTWRAKLNAWHARNPAQAHFYRLYTGVLPSDPRYPMLYAELAATNLEARVARERYLQALAHIPKRPWLLTHPRIPIVGACIVMSLWLLWGLLRSVGAPRKLSPTARDPACEFCGYNLTTIPMQSRCPECGEPVVNSLGSNVRLGSPWSQPSSGSKQWFDTVTLAAGKPEELGRQLRLFPTDVTHRRFLMWSLPPAFVVGFLGVILALVVARPPSGDFLEILLIAGPIVGGLSVCGAVLLPNLAALIVSAFYWFTDKRNLMPGAIQIACYLAGYVMLYLIAGNVGMTCAILAFQEPFGWLELLAEAVNIQKGMLAFLSLWLANAAMLIFYVVLVARGTAAMRYANR